MSDTKIEPQNFQNRDIQGFELKGVCQTCNLWEPEKKYRPEMANMGYCPLFDKKTRFDHGAKCTGHSDLRRE